MSAFHYFKITFAATSTGITVALFLYLLFGIFMGDEGTVGQILFKSLVTGIGTGLVLGLLNMYFKIGPFGQKK